MALGFGALALGAAFLLRRGRRPDPGPTTTAITPPRVAVAPPSAKAEEPVEQPEVPPEEPRTSAETPKAPVEPSATVSRETGPATPPAVPGADRIRDQPELIAPTELYASPSFGMITLYKLDETGTRIPPPAPAGLRGTMQKGPASKRRSSRRQEEVAPKRMVGVEREKSKMADLPTDQREAT